MIGFLNVGFKVAANEVKYTNYEFKLMWFCGWFKWSRIYLTLENMIRLVSREPRFGVCLGLYMDCLNTFCIPGRSSTIEFQYPGPDMQFLLKYIVSSQVYFDLPL
jgi:hypothetical protein